MSDHDPFDQILSPDHAVSMRSGSARLSSNVQSPYWDGFAVDMQIVRKPPSCIPDKSSLSPQVIPSRRANPLPTASARPRSVPEYSVLQPQSQHSQCAVPTIITGIRSPTERVAVHYQSGVVPPTSPVGRDIDLPTVVETEESPGPACSDHDVKRGKERRLFLGGGAQRPPSPREVAPGKGASSILQPSASVQKGPRHPSISMGTMSPDFSRFRTYGIPLGVTRHRPN